MQRAKKIKPENLKRLCWAKGMSVSDLARRIGVNRVTVHVAVAQPNRYGPTMRKIEEVLCA